MGKITVCEHIMFGYVKVNSNDWEKGATVFCPVCDKNYNIISKYEQPRNDIYIARRYHIREDLLEKIIKRGEEKKENEEMIVERALTMYFLGIEAAEEERLANERRNKPKTQEQIDADMERGKEMAKERSRPSFSRRSEDNL